MKKINRHKIIALAAATAVLQSALVGCSGDGERYENARTAPEGDCAKIYSQYVAADPIPVNKVHLDFESFKKSKPSLDPFVIHEYHDVEGSGQVLSCKFKSPEEIARHFDREAKSFDCLAVNKAILEQVQIQLGGTALAFEGIVFDSADEVRMGPSYLRPWPYPVAYKQAGELHIRTKQLYAAADSWMPVPKSFKGTQYCHLIRPDYASALLSGEAEAATE